MKKTHSHKTDYRQWLAKAVAILAGVSFAAALGSNWLLYEVAFQQETTRLVELAKTQAILINEVVTLDTPHVGAPQSSTNTFAKLKSAHQQYPGFGETGEFTLGTLKDGNIVFLLSHRHFDFSEPIPIPWASHLGEPMRRALLGNSGVVIGYDYRGETVLAAHEPLPALKAGIVAKIDIKEIRAPFIRAGLIGMAGVLIMVLVGAMVFRRISIPLMEREQALVELRTLSHAIEQSPNMMFITDTKGRIEYVNPRFTKMTGYTLEEALGQTPRILKSIETPRGFYQDMWRNLTAGREWRSEIKNRRKNGETFWASMVAAPVKDDAGNLTHFIAIHEDITDRKHALEQTRQAREQAEVANRAKSEIMANMSHELRTPLNAIIGFSSTMKDGVFGPMGCEKYSEYADYIHSSGAHLLDIINDILDVAAVEAGKLELNEETVNLAEICEAALRLISPKAQDSLVTLTNFVAAELPPILADPRRMKQICLNVLSNAVKFTPAHGEVSCNAYVDPSGSMVLTITDTGIGMDENGLAKAMAQFGQVDSSLARKEEGSGLGLPLTQGLVELHGGDLNLTSEPGRGTQVSIRFPSERVQVPAQAEAL